VLPVRLLAEESSNSSELAHTLDITNAGVRLGGLRRPPRVGTRLTLQYKQHKAEFRVIWVMQLKELKEHHIGLEAVVERDLWGLAAELRARVQMMTPATSLSSAGA
jgi:hypothetical protein